MGTDYYYFYFFVYKMFLAFVTLGTGGLRWFSSFYDLSAANLSLSLQNDGLLV